MAPVAPVFHRPLLRSPFGSVAQAAVTAAVGTAADVFEATFPALSGKTTDERLRELGMSMPAASGALSGAAFGASILNDTQDAREEKTEAALLAGHIPAELRELHPVRISATVDGVPAQAIIYVMKDYVSVGTDADALRIPMYSATAQRVADKWGARLPTAKVVDAVNKAATVKIPFAKRTPGNAMESTAEFIAYDKEIDAAVSGRTGLIAQHKKDTVLSMKRSEVRNGKSQINEVAIYGGVHPNGARVQPEATPHFHRHSDYSQGIRYVAPRVRVQRGNGEWEWKSYDALLADPTLYVLVSHQRILPPFNRYPTDPWAGAVKPKSR